MARRIVFPTAQAWQFELEDFIRGISGGFLFGIPLLYTMEAWWIGSITEPPQMLALLGVTYLIVFLLNRTDGFRQVQPDSVRQAAMDSVEALAIAVFCAVLMLILLRQITPSTPLNEAIGKIVIEGMPFALGVALARSILQEEDEPDAHSDALDCSPPPPPPPHKVAKELLKDVGATLVGAIIIGFSIAPTDEIPMLEAAISPPWLLALLVVSLVLSYCIVFVAGFTAQRQRRQQIGLFQRPLTETVLTYLVSLLTAACMLWFFHRLGLRDPWFLWFKETLILGLPATLGGAAGRLVL
ncbi:MAG: TIGR02587 family membrane protein [Cyanobacteria bacterium Co-bin8]|nr:TIGR02587 family membrane protein [Cyanobacteria bacterium Co-bin8]